jgi:hypothetical protein
MLRTEAKNIWRIIQRTGVELSKSWAASRAESERPEEEDVRKITFEAGMSMKTNKTATMCPPRITRFLSDLTGFVDILCGLWPSLRGYVRFASPIIWARMQPSLQIMQTQGTGAACGAYLRSLTSSLPGTMLAETI